MQFTQTTQTAFYPSHMRGVLATNPNVHQHNIQTRIRLSPLPSQPQFNLPYSDVQLPRRVVAGQMVNRLPLPSTSSSAPFTNSSRTNIHEKPSHYPNEASSSHMNAEIAQSKRSRPSPTTLESRRHGIVAPFQLNSEKRVESHVSDAPVAPISVDAPSRSGANLQRRGHVKKQSPRASQTAFDPEEISLQVPTTPPLRIKKSKSNTNLSLDLTPNPKSILKTTQYSHAHSNSEPIWKPNATVDLSQYPHLESTLKATSVTTAASTSASQPGSNQPLNHSSNYDSASSSTTKKSSKPGSSSHYRRRSMSASTPVATTPKESRTPSVSRSVTKRLQRSASRRSTGGMSPMGSSFSPSNLYTPSIYAFYTTEDGDGEDDSNDDGYSNGSITPTDEKKNWRDRNNREERIQRRSSVISVGSVYSIASDYESPWKTMVTTPKGEKFDKLAPRWLPKRAPTLEVVALLKKRRKAARGLTVDSVADEGDFDTRSEASFI